MATTNFTSGTVIQADWLNDADEAAYGLITFPRGEGTGASGYTSGAKYQIINNDSTADQFATLYVRKNADHTGGTVGYTPAAIRADLYVTESTDTNYEWAIIGMVDSYATAGQNVGGYFQGRKRAAGPVWGATIEVIEYTGADPTSGTVALEVDVRANGTDTNNARVGIDMVMGKQDTGGTAGTFAYGIRLQDAEGAGTNTCVRGFSTYNMECDVGFDTSASTINQASFKMAENQPIAFNANATRKLFHNGASWEFTDAANNEIWALNDNYSLTANGVQLLGTRDTGWSAFTGATNKATVYGTGTVTLVQLAERVAALQAALTTHGLLGT